MALFGKTRKERNLTKALALLSRSLSWTFDKKVVPFLVNSRCKQKYQSASIFNIVDEKNLFLEAHPVSLCDQFLCVLVSQTGEGGDCLSERSERGLGLYPN